MNDQTSYLWVYYNNALGVAMALSNRISNGETLNEGEAMLYHAALDLNAQHCRNLLNAITPKEADDVKQE